MEHSFKKSCVSNTLDGTEDDIVWENTGTDDSQSKTIQKNCILKMKKFKECLNYFTLLIFRYAQE